MLFHWSKLTSKAHLFDASSAGKHGFDAVRAAGGNYKKAPVFHRQNVGAKKITQDFTQANARVIWNVAKSVCRVSCVAGDFLRAGIDNSVTKGLQREPLSGSEVESRHFFATRRLNVFPRITHWKKSITKSD